MSATQEIKDELNTDSTNVKPPRKKRVEKLGRKLYFIVMGMIILLGVIVIFLSEGIFTGVYGALCNNKLNELVKLGADSMEISVLEEYYKTGVESPEIKSYKRLFENIRRTVREIDYLYVYKPYEDKFVYLMDTSVAGDDPSLYSQFGDEYYYSEWDYEHLVPSIEKAMPTKGILEGPDNGFGKVIEAWYPIVDKDGNTAFMVEADMKISEVEGYVKAYMTVVVIAFATAIILIGVIYIGVNKRIISRPLKELTNYVESYEDGGFKAKPFRRKTNDELTILAQSFERLNEKIKKYIIKLTNATKESERINTELELATRIQANYLPNKFPAFPEHKEFDLYATMNTAKEVGGDFYDFFFCDEKHLALVMADVSGKGVGAALFMMRSKTLLNDWATSMESPAKILERVNNLICERNEEEMFVTVWLGIIDIETGVMKAANAGHEYPAIKRADGDFELYKDSHSFVVGGMEGIKYKEYELTLNKDDVFFIYTDGVPEATNINEELFGTDRMLDSLNRVKDKNVNEILPALKKDIDDFVGEASMFDDVTMLGFKYFGY